MVSKPRDKYYFGVQIMRKATAFGGTMRSKTATAATPPPMANHRFAIDCAAPCR
ncbi:MAG: hypothetical protein RR205_03110 [Oscillospiraceae bacterium]